MFAYEAKWPAHHLEKWALVFSSAPAPQSSSVGGEQEAHERRRGNQATVHLETKRGAFRIDPAARYRGGEANSESGWRAGGLPYRN